ncbi:MAG: hydroxyacid dehydrogenase [Syntrophales bacterium]|nr:hydroxyacid dehydrogenase [Syntrophales bacterium]
MNKIILVERIHPAGEAMLAKKAELVYPQPQNLEGILSAIGDCNALVVRNTKITRQIMEAAPQLAVIGRHGVGYDTVDIAAAAALGIAVVYTPAANTESVVEIAIGFIICLGRKIVEAHAAMQSEQLLSDTVTMSILTRQKGLINADLWGKTLGVVGVGRIGSSVAKRMKAAFNMRVLGYDPYVDEDTLSGYGVQKMSCLKEMLPQCDFINIHCSGGAETRHLLDAGMLALMKPEAYLINTARGTVVDEAALIDALQRKQIAGAALDVYDPEPPRPGNPLLHMENVIVTPHFCAMTEESLYNMATMVAQGVIDVLEGRQPQYPVI